MLVWDGVVFLFFKRSLSLPRSPRADTASGWYHALNQGNLRSDIFRKASDAVAVEKISSEVLERYEIEMFSYQLMANHYYLVLRPLVAREISRFIWAGLEGLRR